MKPSRHGRRPVMFLPALAALLAGAVLVGCDGLPGLDATPEHHQRDWDNETLQYGERLYMQNCAVCHGENREGAENWRQRDADGYMPPPPLDGRAHTWHHPYWQLKDMIRYGAEARGGAMPSFEDTLSYDDVEAIIAFIQAQWPDEIFEAWIRYDQNHPTQEAWEEEMGEPWVTHVSDPRNPSTGHEHH